MILQQHLQLADFLRARLTTVAARSAPRPPAQSARGAHDRLIELKREIRRAESLRSAIPAISAAPWSPVHAWIRGLRSPHERRIRRLKKQMAALRRETGIAEPEVWKPRPATAADRRIARQYRDVEATGLLWRVTRSGKYRAAV